MKKCKDCTIWELMKKTSSLQEQDSEEQFESKLLASKMIMEKCFDCDNFKLKDVK